MKQFKKSLLAISWLTVAPPVLATPSTSPSERYASMCQGSPQERGLSLLGTPLWGTRRKAADENSSVLVSVGLANVGRDNAGVKALRLEAGHLVAEPTQGTERTPGSAGVIGAVLQGTASDGKTMEVAICGAEPSVEAPEMVWYRIETWNIVTQAWENPCAATGQVPDPRAVAVAGVWDARGAHHEAAGRFTLACENSAISKCIRWGYRPWARHDGQSLADLHQACTRMARADYCGDGHSHTSEGIVIDMYDRFKLLSPTTEALVDWDPARGSFEAAWAPDGASCLAHSRDGQPLEAVLKECPTRFQAGAPVELGEGDRCTLTRAGAGSAPPLLRNRSYAAPRGPRIR